MRNKLGNLSKAYVDSISDNKHLVYAYSSKYKRFVNSHMWQDKKEAFLTRDSINGK